jgi:hypothetical protein
MAYATAVSINEKGELGFKKRYHASGHASGEDITWAIEQIDPDYIVPIHADARDWFAKSFENVVMVEEARLCKGSGRGKDWKDSWLFCSWRRSLRTYSTGGLPHEYRSPKFGTLEKVAINSSDIKRSLGTRFR